MVTEQAHAGWYLHSQGRRFGPLSEDDLRGYFRAGMVRVGDMVTPPGQTAMQTAADIAQSLNEAPPKPALPNPPAPIIHAPLPADHPALAMFNFPPTPEPKRSAWLLPVLGLVALVAMMFVGLMVLRRFQTAQIAPAQATAPSADARQFVAGEPASGAVEGGAPDLTVPAQPTADAVSRAWFDKADALARSGDWPGLVDASQQWSDAEPDRNEPWLFLGSAQARLGRNADAIFALDQVLKREPTHVAARTALADVYLQDGQNENAATILRDLLRSDPSNSTLWNNLGNALIAMNHYDESVTALETAVRVDPNNRQAWKNLGTVYRSAGYAEKAAAAFANAGVSN